MRILESLTWAEIQAGLGASALGSTASSPRGASIDTRTLEKGDIFFALKGAHVDGHDHLDSAVAKGASGLVIRDPQRAPRGSLALIVNDPELALFELGRLVRARSAACFVAITGSAGKTTAKEFTAELLRAQGPVLATRGNLNNHLGVPLTLARLEKDHGFAVIECGMSHAGEIARLVRLVRPKVAAITNAAAVHLEFFASVDEIAAAKSEIFEILQTGDVAVAPADDARLANRALASRGTARLFGEGPGSSTRAEAVSMSIEGSRFDLQQGESRFAVSLNVAGPHAIKNFLAAAAIVNALGMSTQAIAARAPRLKSGATRGSLKHLEGDIVLIDDSYNSNPLALLAAIETLGLASGRRRVACIGDMLELGPSGPQLHREAGVAMGTRIDRLLGAGSLASQLIDASPLDSGAKKAYADSAAMAADISAQIQDRDAVLIKGSRGARMERVVEALLAARPGAEA